MVDLELYIYLVYECMMKNEVTDEVYYARSFVKYKKGRKKIRIIYINKKCLY